MDMIRAGGNRGAKIEVEYRVIKKLSHEVQGETKEYEKNCYTFTHFLDLSARNASL